MSATDDPFGVHLGIDLDIAPGQWGETFGDDVARDLMANRLPRIERVGCLPGGMLSGAASFSVAIRLEDGRVVIAETSWRAMAAALRALEARHPVE